MRTITFLLISVFCLWSLVFAQETASFKPNPRLTPGATLELTEKELCERHFESSERTIPIALKSQVVDRYAINLDAGGYNVDHLIPVGLGGSNSVKNLWPQPLAGEWSYFKKNQLEARLRKIVCKGELDLKQAQQEIATDWVSAYKKYVGESAR
jgi:hypothetical protein